MTATLAEWLMDTSILQFGYFVNGDNVAPVRFCPEYLPAYPKLLAEMAGLALLQLTVSEVDHLIATFESVPLGLVCSLETGLSLVYSRGRGESPVYDLAGSYNSGHVCALLMNCVEDKTIIEQFISNARSVGLDIQAIVTLFEIRPIDKLAGITVRSVFRLGDMVKELVNIGRLSIGQAQAVLTWIHRYQP